MKVYEARYGLQHDVLIFVYNVEVEVIVVYNTHKILFSYSTTTYEKWQSKFTLSILFLGLRAQGWTKIMYNICTVSYAMIRFFY